MQRGNKLQCTRAGSFQLQIIKIVPLFFPEHWSQRVRLCMCCRKTSILFCEMIRMLSKKTIDLIQTDRCPDCVVFSPTLTKVYNEAKAANKNFEVVFVSSDTTEESMSEYVIVILLNCGVSMNIHSFI